MGCDGTNCSARGETCCATNEKIRRIVFNRIKVFAEGGSYNAVSQLSFYTDADIPW